jgi:hypothetical protein
MPLNRHTVLVWIAGFLNVIVFMARLVFPAWDRELARVDLGVSLLLLVGCVILFRWSVRNGPGPYREHSGLR